MKYIAIIVLALFCTGKTCAQKSELVRVKAGDEIVQVLSKRIYRYPSFTSANIFFRDGNASSAMLNFNFLIGEMQFIAPEGDTLSIANEKTIRLIAIGTDSFYYDKGYLELINSAASLKLAMKQRIKVVDTQKIGAYDQPSSASSISSYTTFSSGNRNFKLDVRQDVLLSKETIYYLGDKFNSFFPANKKNLMNIFSKHQNDISNYLKTSSINFNNEEDLKKLMVFLQQF